MPVLTIRTVRFTIQNSASLYPLFPTASCSTFAVRNENAEAAAAASVRTTANVKWNCYRIPVPC